MQTFDFSRSYFRFQIDLRVQPAITVTQVWKTTLNNVRINVEARCELTHRPTGRAQVYVLSASCKTERVGAQRDVWPQPNADFCVAASDEEFLVLKNWARHDMPVPREPMATGVPLERQSGRCSEAWADFGVDMQLAVGRPLETLAEISAAGAGSQPLVARTEYDEGDYHVVLDYPVKTFNFSERDKVYQTDTGPILLPDLSPARLRAGTRLIDCFDLAYAAFNSSGWAEFIVNVPTPIADDVEVHHYSQPRRIEPARNILIEVQEESPVPRHHLTRERDARERDTAHKLDATRDGSARSDGSELFHPEGPNTARTARSNADGAAITTL